MLIAGLLSAAFWCAIQPGDQPRGPAPEAPAAVTTTGPAVLLTDPAVAPESSPAATLQPRSPARAQR